jgi:hypothetical protein
MVDFNKQYCIELDLILFILAMVVRRDVTEAGSFDEWNLSASTKFILKIM